MSLTAFEFMINASKEDEIDVPVNLILSVFHPLTFHTGGVLAKCMRQNSFIMPCMLTHHIFYSPLVNSKSKIPEILNIGRFFMANICKRRQK